MRIYLPEKGLFTEAAMIIESISEFVLALNKMSR